MTVTSPSTINRKVHSLDDVTIKMVPAARMKTKYDFTTGVWLLLMRSRLTGF